MAPVRPPFPHTLCDLLHLNDSFSRNIALFTENDSVSYEMLSKQVLSMATQLRQAMRTLSSSQEGKTLLTAMPNGHTCIITFLAVTCVAQCAPLNAEGTRNEFDANIQSLKPNACIVMKGHKTMAEESAKNANIVIIEVDVSTKNEKVTLNVQGESETAKRMRNAVQSTKNIDDVKTFDIKPSDIALVLHTSGTTSKPKTVPLTHGTLSASVRNIIETYNLQPTDVGYLVMPLFHVHGLVAGMLAPLGSGGAIKVTTKFSAQRFWKDFADGNCTWYTAVPTMHAILLQQEQQKPSKSYHGRIRFIRSCSSPMSEAVYNGLVKLCNVPVCEAYAMTEASHQMTSNPLRGPQKANSVGKPHGGVRLTIRDDQDREVPQGERGEVCVKGDNVMPGYLNNPKANAENFTASGWFRTGDQGYLDSDGYLFLTGRLKEFINRGGEKISPIEVDNSLLSHEGVEEAVAFPAPNDLYGQEVNAAVVLKPAFAAKHPDSRDVEQILKKHAATSVAKFKVPVRIFVTDHMPKNATGKIQRRNVAEHFLSKQPRSKL